MDCSLPGSSIHRIFQARILEWVAISSSRGSSWPRDRTWVSCIAGRLFTVWATREATLSVPLHFVQLSAPASSERLSFTTLKIQHFFHFLLSLLYFTVSIALITSHFSVYCLSCLKVQALWELEFHLFYSLVPFIVLLTMSNPESVSICWINLMKRGKAWR